MPVSWTKRSDQFVPCETSSANNEWYWKIAIWSCADTLYFRLRDEKNFFVKILLLLPKFHEKTLSRPGDINFFFQRGGCTSTLFPHLWTQCWVKKGNWYNGWEYSRLKFSGGDFQGGSLMSRNFPGGLLHDLNNIAWLYILNYFCFSFDLLTWLDF